MSGYAEQGWADAGWADEGWADQPGVPGGSSAATGFQNMLLLGVG